MSSFDPGHIPSIDPTQLGPTIQKLDEKMALEQANRVKKDLETDDTSALNKDLQRLKEVLSSIDNPKIKEDFNQLQKDTVPKMDDVNKVIDDLSGLVGPE